MSTQKMRSMKRLMMKRPSAAVAGVGTSATSKGVTMAVKMSAEQAIPSQ